MTKILNIRLIRVTEFKGPRREIFRRAESTEGLYWQGFSKHRYSWTHLCLYCTSMATWKSLSPACVAGHLVRSCPTPSGTEKLRSQGLIQFRLEGNSGSWSADQPYCSSYTGSPCLPWCLYTSSLGSAISLCLCPQHQFICLRVGCCSHLTRH